MSSLSQTRSPSARRHLVAPARQVLGPWRLLRPIGQGALSAVYLAAPDGENEEDAACYAVKVLKQHWHESREALDMFRREAAVGSKVAHPHLVSVLDWGLSQPPHYIVMPFLAGMTADRAWPGVSRPPLPTALWVARQAAEGLGALHASGYMHADVKPENLMFSPEGHVTLLDLGFAGPPARGASVAARPLVGTLCYMAPEVLTSTLAADIRSDIYSLGVVLYELLTGELPYEGRNPVEVLAMQRQGVPDRLRCLAPLLPPGVVKLVRSMLSAEPLRRPQTPAEVVMELARLEIEVFTERVPA